ncbi:MAG: hypothetical protein GX424_07755 [Clostridiales bacterium]|jgi:membrane protein involved in colicin uptake|nr:hypothetical protein [Clostridiales bacterium]
MDEAEQERQKRMDERFERTRQDMEKLEGRQCAEEDRCRKLEELNIKMGEILKNHEEKLENHDRRIGALENVAGARWNLIVNYLLAGAVGALAAAVMRIILGG